MVSISRNPMEPKDVMIHVVVPFYNCQRWITRCLHSIGEQDHPNLNVVAIDDASTDSGGTYAQMVCESYGWTCIRNSTNIKCPHNLVVGINATQAKKHDVIFLVDGDDYLPHPGIFTRFAQIFSEADTWMTYGQYLPTPADWGCAPAVPPSNQTVQSRSFRAAPIFFNHPIVFRKFLWDSIPEEQFKDDRGNWFTAGYDRTIIYPLLERSTEWAEWNSARDTVEQELHWKFLNEVSYFYNSENPCSDWRMNPGASEDVNIVHTRPPLDPLRPHYVGTKTK